MSEQQISTLPKDWVAMVVGIIGCILAIISLIRTIRLERRTILEPYFKAHWSDFENKVSEHLQNVEIWLGSEYKMERTSGNFNYPSRIFIEDSLDDKMKKYSRKLSVAFDKYAKKNAKVNFLIDEYNTLIDAKDGFNRSNIESKDFPLNEKDKEYDRNRIEKLKAIRKNYLGETENEEELLVFNSIYQNDLKSLAKKIEGHIPELKKSHRKLSSLIKIYGATFQTQDNK